VKTWGDLSRPIDPRILKTRKQGTATLTYCPWNTIAKHLHHLAPGWCWEVQSVQEVGGALVVTGLLTIPTADGDLLHYSAVASEPLESASKAPAADVAAYSCLRRAAALAGRQPWTLHRCIHQGDRGYGRLSADSDAVPRARPAMTLSPCFTA